MGHKVGLEGNEFWFKCPNLTCGVTASWNVIKEVGNCRKCGRVFKEPPEELGGKLSTRSRDFVLSSTKYSDGFSKHHVAIDYNNPAHINAINYLLSDKRRISEETCKAAKLRYVPGVEEIFFPITSPLMNAKPSYWRRKIFEKSYKSLPGVKKAEYGYVFGLEHVQQRDVVILVEGPFDVLTPGLLGYAVGLLGVEIPLNIILWLGDFKKVYCYLDPDAYDASKKWKYKLSQAYDIPIETVNYYKEPGDCTEEDVSFINSLKRGDYVGE